MGKDERALITAEMVTSGTKHNLHAYRLTKAILAFLPLGGMEERFRAAGGQSILWGSYWKTWVRGDGTVLLGPIFGGPMCAVAVEELAACGVRDFIGYGASGTMDASVPPCAIMTAAAGLRSDGTTRDYTRRREIPADSALLERLRESLLRRGLPDITGKVWTTDSIYREYPSTVAYWRARGARFVNMETSTFYAVAGAKGARAAYLSAVSDNVSGEKWSGWHDGFNRAYDVMCDIALEVAADL